LLATSYILNYK